MIKGSAAPAAPLRLPQQVLTVPLQDHRPFALPYQVGAALSLEAVVDQVPRQLLEYYIDVQICSCRRLELEHEVIRLHQLLDLITAHHRLPRASVVLPACLGEQIFLGANQHSQFVPAFGLFLEVSDPVGHVEEALPAASSDWYLSMEYMKRTASVPLK